MLYQLSYAHLRLITNILRYFRAVEKWGNGGNRARFIVNQRWNLRQDARAVMRSKVTEESSDAPPLST